MPVTTEGTDHNAQTCHMCGQPFDGFPTEEYCPPCAKWLGMIESMEYHLDHLMTPLLNAYFAELRMYHQPATARATVTAAMYHLACKHVERDSNRVDDFSSLEIPEGVTRAFLHWVTSWSLPKVNRFTIVLDYLDRASQPLTHCFMLE